MSDYAARSHRFKELHERDETFVLPNPWDVGSAKILAHLGFEALATTSAGYAFSQGRADGTGSARLEDALSHAEEIIAATDLPVSADLENGFSDDPKSIASVIQRAAEIGLSGCTIEDTTGDPASPIYDKTLAVERIAAAAEVLRSLPHPFMLTARAENYLHGRPDFDDTLDRLSQYESVGASVVYAPGLPDLEAIRTVCATVKVSVNVLHGPQLSGVTLGDLADAGATRISTGSQLARAAYGAFISASTDLRDHGDFSRLIDAPRGSEIEALITGDTGS